MPDTTPERLAIRPSVIAFAAISFALKTALILLLVVPTVIGLPGPLGPGVLLALLVAVVVSTLARSFVVRRVSAPERAIVEFWSITPLLILLTAGMLSALPAIFIKELTAWLGWPESALRYGLVFLLAGSMISAAIVIWAFWRQFRASLPSAPA